MAVYEYLKGVNTEKEEILSRMAQKQWSYE